MKGKDSRKTRVSIVTSTPVSLTSLSQHVCGDASVYCPAGSSSPIAASEGFYTVEGASDGFDRHPWQGAAETRTAEVGRAGVVVHQSPLPVPPLAPTHFPFLAAWRLPRDQAHTSLRISRDRSCSCLAIRCSRLNASRVSIAQGGCDYPALRGGSGIRRDCGSPPARAPVPQVKPWMPRSARDGSRKEDRH